MGDLFLLPPDLLRALPPSPPLPPPSRLTERFLGEGALPSFRGDGEESTGLVTSFFSSGFRLPPVLGLESFLDFLDFFLLSLSLLESLELELESLLESLLELELELLVFLFFLSCFLSFSLLLPFLSSPLLSELLPRDFLPFSFSSGFPFSSPPAPPVPGAILLR